MLYAKPKNDATPYNLTGNILLLVAITPLLAVLGLTRSIGLQAIVTMLTGVIAWYAFWIQRKQLNPPGYFYILLCTYIVCCVLSLLANLSPSNAFGSPLTRLGSVELIACVGIGLALLQVSSARLTVWLYTSLTAVGIASLPYTLLHTHHWVRISGIVFQPDFLAILSAVAILLGCHLWIQYVRYRALLTVSQGYLVVLIFLTQTRAVLAILLVVLLLMTWLLQYSLLRRVGITVFILVTVAVGTIAVKPLTTGRLTDAGFASESANYRLVLQHHAATQLTNKPVFGYGASDTAKALTCKSMTEPALLKTCNDGYYFNSSHNIFLDRFLALGWIGGLNFLTISATLLWRAFFVKTNDKTFALCAILIALYYLTNVTSLHIELLYWVFLLRPLASHASASP